MGSSGLLEQKGGGQQHFCQGLELGAVTDL
ncbi:unnamed protein product, partial [Vitis vinifera]|uniref:Uncharacterized protein n=1 Tax=Vitis vinifera TaxID=29760 RepID=D7T000_VITVI